MTRKHWVDLGPSLVVATGTVVTTLIAVQAARSGRFVLAGPLLLALTVVSADMLHSRLKGKPLRPSWTALLLGGIFLLAGVIVIGPLREPGQATALYAVFGSAAWVAIPKRAERARTACREL